MNTLSEIRKMNSPLLKQLFDSFGSYDLKYCVWKGRADFADVLSGEDDVDLLVARQDSQMAQKILFDLGFKLSQPCRDKFFPGLVDYYGYDSQLGCIIHIQLYHQLICGERLVENFHLPIEHAFIEGREYVEGVAFAEPAAELTVFLLRKLVQNGITFLRRRNTFEKFAKDVQGEVGFLLSLTSIEEVSDFVSRHLPTVDSLMLCEALDIIGQHGTNRSRVWRWLRVRAVVMSQLSAYKRRGHIARHYEWVVRRCLIYRNKRLFKGAPGRTPASGGRAIAIIGSDGAGKSTTVSFLIEYLASAFQSTSYHMGRPSPSISTRVLSRVVRVMTHLSGGKMRMPKPGQEQRQYWPKLIVWLPMLLGVSIARDRYRTYCKVRRDVGFGRCVIIDRYPIEGIEWMDRPMINRIAGSEGKFEFLKAIEQSYYARISPAEQTILLIVSPEIAAKRQASDGYDYVIERATKMHEIVPMLNDSIDIIDTSCSIEEVQAKVVEKIWAEI